MSKYNSGFITKHSGFTLIEIMLVMVIIAIISTFVVVRFNGNNNLIAKEESKRFFQVIQTAKQFSLYTGSVIGIKLNEFGYQSAVLDPETSNWNTSKAKSINDGFKKHNFNENISIEYSIDGKKANAERKSSSSNRTARYSREDEQEFLESINLLFSPVGEFPIFLVNFIGDDKTFQVELKDNGKLEIIDCKDKCKL